MTNQLKTTLLASAAALAVTGTAHASTASVCALDVVPCIYDQAGNALGVFQTQGILNRMIGGTWYFAGYDANGFTKDLTLFYASTDCSGQALFPSGYFTQDNVTPIANTPPTWTAWDGANFWSGVGPTAVVDVHSTLNLSGTCSPYSTNFGWGWPTFSPARVIGTPQLRPAPRGVGSCGGSTGVACVTVK